MDIYFFFILALQVYGLFRGMTPTLALVIGILCVIYGLLMLFSPSLFGIVWLLIGVLYFSFYNKISEF